MTLSAGDRLGPYEILTHLGAGGMGEVWTARDTRLRRTVAIKVLPADKTADPERKQRFLQEARAASALNHPNIVTIYDIANYDGIDVLVMEYVPGQALDHRIGKKPIPLTDTLSYAKQAASALSAAHAAGIVHRDIKPGNIIVTAEGHLKLLDFGLAKLEEPALSAEDATLTIGQAPTRIGTVMGTIAYMSPEQARGEKLDGRTDLFSLGAVLYEMCTGRRAFARLYDWRLPSMTDVPASLRPVIEKLLNPDRERRYNSASDLLGDLKPTAAPAKIAVPRKWAAAAVAVFILLSAGWYWWPGRDAGRIDSLAVFPFENGDHAPDTEYLTDGLTESLIGNLSQMPGLKVMSRSAVFRYRDKAFDPRVAGRELGVRAVLTGRVIRRGDDLSVSVELVNVEDDTALWAGQYNSRKVKDALAVQADITSQIVEKLRFQLSSQQTSQLASYQTRNPEAYQLYLKGRYYAGKFDPENLARGRDYLQQAVAADPNFALAYEGLSFYYNLLVDWYEPATEAGPKAIEAARKALELDPNLAEAHVELASAHMFYDFDWPLVEREFKRALELNPNYAEAHEYYAWYLVEMGRGSEALAEAHKAVQLDPLAAETAFIEAWISHYNGHYEDAIEQARKSRELDSNQWMSYMVEGQADEQLKRYSEALAAFRKASEILGGIPSPVRAEEARVLALSGKREEATRNLRRLEEDSKQRQMSKYELARVYVALGNSDKAFSLMNQAYEEHSFMLGFLKVDPELNGLHPDPRYGQLVAKIKLP